MIKIYLTNIAGLPDPLRSPEFLYTLPQGRRESIYAAISLNARRQRLGAGLLLGTVLAEYGVSWDELYLGEHGKPLSTKLKFNLSHSGSFVALAVSEKGNVGCDIEMLRGIPNEVLRKLPEQERVWLDGFSQDEKTREFFRLWTRRESYLKMTGEGLSGFWGIKFISEEEVLRNGIRQQCFFYEFKPEGYALCLCSDVEQICRKPIEVQLG